MIDLSLSLPIKVQNGGLFISRGVGEHPRRCLTSWELIAIEKGALSIREGEQTFTVHEGESLLLYPGRTHEGVGTFPPGLKFYWLHFELEMPAAGTPLPAADTASLFSIPQHGHFRDPPYAHSLFRQFLMVQENNPQPPELELILLLLLRQIAWFQQDNDAAATAGLNLAWRARQLILTQFHQPVSTSSLARQLHCNPDYLGRVYRRIFHLTLTEAIHRQRIIHAERLLLSGRIALEEVARQSGFQDVRYFREVFRKERGVTPGAWRRRYSKEHVNSD